MLKHPTISGRHGAMKKKKTLREQLFAEIDAAGGVVRESW